MFLKSNSTKERLKLAEKISKHILGYHEKDELINHIVDLSILETTSRKNIHLEKQRDHVIHSLLCFLLGIQIGEILLKDIDNYKFQWKLASLLHDIAYPFEITEYLVGHYIKKFNDTKESIIKGIPNLIIYNKPFIKNIDHLISSGEYSLELIQNRLNDWGLQDINASIEFENMSKKDKIDHGILGLLLLLFIIDLMYYRYEKRLTFGIFSHDIPSWDRKYFYGDVVSPCTGIFIHNLDNNAFSVNKINRNKAPVAFLLKLVDTLQDWERPSLIKPKGYSRNLYDIIISSLIIEYRCPSMRKHDIRNDILETLEISPLEIIFS